MAKKRQISRYVAFLRGINVGGHRVKMDALRELFMTLKFANVATFIASGNVIFESSDSDAAALESRIEAHLKASLGYEVQTFLRTLPEIATIAAFRPFESDDIDTAGHTLHIGFLRSAPGDQSERDVLSFRTEMDDFLIHGRELYWLCRGRSIDSQVSWQVVGKKIAASSTMRNVKTIRKLALVYPPE